MGRTVPAFRPALDHEISTWEDFKRGLRPKERKTFDTLMNYSRVHSDAGSLAARPVLSEVLFMTMILEQQKTIERLEAKIHAIEGEMKNK